MDWFESLTGFRETGYAQTRAKLEVENNQLRSLVNGKSYGIGQLELVQLQTLRERVQEAGRLPGSLKVTAVSGDVRKMHGSPDNAGALFQVASQFNLLEMISPEISPEHGVTRYERDHTQGPACAIAAGAATIYRNYFAPVNGHSGQTMTRQLDGLADVRKALTAALNRPLANLWTNKNGYVVCNRDELEIIAAHLRSLQPAQTDLLRGHLRIGLHWDVEVTDIGAKGAPRVSQAFCSALPVAYSREPPQHWELFAALVLEAAYEATMWAAVVNAQRKESNIVFLTALGGGAFGNDPGWIHAAMRRALKLVAPFALDVRIVSYGPSPQWNLQIAEEFAGN